MTWTSRILSIESVDRSLPDPLHVAIDGDLAHLDELAVLDHDEPGPVGGPMIFARKGERRRDPPGVEVPEALERLLDRLPGGIGASPLDRLGGEDDPEPSAHVRRGAQSPSVMLLVEVHQRLHPWHVLS